MKILGSLSLLVLVLFLGGCSSKPRNEVAGAQWLERKEGGSIYDVLAYPLSEDELVVLETAIPGLERAAVKYPKFWAEVSYADDPSEVSTPNSLWEEAEVLGSDVMAVVIKLNFLREFGSGHAEIESDMQENLSWLEERMQRDGASEELLETADSMRAILGVIEAYRESGAFSVYQNEQLRFDAALDRFLSIGEK